MSCQRSHLCWLGIATDAVAAAKSMPRAACNPFLSRNLSCLNNVVWSAPPSKPVPSSCLVAFSHNCSSIEARKACQKPQSSIPTPPALRLHLLPPRSFQDVCRIGSQLCCMSVTITADMCPRTNLHLVVGLLAIIAVAIAQTLPILGMSLWLRSQKMSHCLMTLHGIWMAGSAFGCKSAIVVVKHLPRCAASEALVRACSIHRGGAPTAAVPQAFCAQAPVLQSRAVACFEVHLPNLAHLLVRLRALAHFLAMVRRIGFLALDTSKPRSLA